MNCCGDGIPRRDVNNIPILNILSRFFIELHLWRKDGEFTLLPSNIHLVKIYLVVIYPNNSMLHYAEYNFYKKVATQLYVSLTDLMGHYSTMTFQLLIHCFHREPTLCCKIITRPTLSFVWTLWVVMNTKNVHDILKTFNMKYVNNVVIFKWHAHRKV